MNLFRRVVSLFFAVVSTLVCLLLLTRDPVPVMPVIVNLCAALLNLVNFLAAMKAGTKVL